MKEAELKKMEDVFNKVKQEEPLDNIETFFIPDNDIFDGDDISEADRQFIMDLVNCISYCWHKKVCWRYAGIANGNFR